MNMNNSNTNSSTTTVSDEVQLKLAFNEYQLECAAEDTKPKTYHQWLNQGNIATPTLIATATGTTPVVTNNGTVPKSLIARQVFAKHAATGTLVRKNIIVEFQVLAGLTPAGAATYYANIGAAYKKDPAAFMTANYVAPVIEEEEIEVILPEVEMVSEMDIEAEMDEESTEELVEVESANDEFSDFSDEDEAA